MAQLEEEAPLVEVKRIITYQGTAVLDDLDWPPKEVLLQETPEQAYPEVLDWQLQASALLQTEVARFLPTVQ